MSKKFKKLVVYTICHNEANTIGELLKRIPRRIDGISKIETLVISDGSSDETVKIATECGATNIIEGRSQKRLAYRFEQAIETALSMGADIAVGIDGDLQFEPEQIPKLVEPILKGSCEFVAGDRFSTLDGKLRRPKDMPTGKYLGNRLGAWIIGKLSGEHFNDVTCGFRAYSKKAMLALNINSQYTYTQESFQILAAKKITTVSVPITVHYHKGRKSRVVRSLGQFIFGSALNIIRFFRDYAPLKFFGILGLASFIPGFAMASFVCWHWANTGSITPYKAIGLIGLYMVSAGLIIWIVGLVGDMLDRVSKNQEKILERLKELKYPDRNN